MIEKAIAVLQNAGFDLTAREIAEILWLSVHIVPSEAESAEKATSEPSVSSSSSSSSLPAILSSSPSTAPPKPPSVPVTLPPSPQLQSSTISQPSGGVPLKVPTPAALRNSLALAKALRPLKRKVPSPTEVAIDEVATATRITEVRLRLPVLKPARQRWLELALVIEQSSTTAVWKQTLVEFQHLLQHQGAFRDVRTWGLKEIDEKIQLFAQTQTGDFTTTARSPKELIDARGQRLILLVSDCISPLWRKGTIYPVLELWGKQGLLSLLQLLPARLWERTALDRQGSGQLRSLSFDSQLRNYKLEIEATTDEDDEEIPSDFTKTIPVPVVTLDPDSLFSWAKVLVGIGKSETVGYCFTYADEKDDRSQPQPSSQTPLPAANLVNRFRATASPLARRLAGLMAITPVNISVVHLIQQTLLTESSQLHVAEVFMSGLLKSFPSSENPNALKYDFVEGVREILRQSVSPSEGILVIEKVSEYIAKRYGLSLRSFEALLLEGDTILDAQIANNVLPFARLTAQALRQWGGEFERIAQQLESQATKQEWFQGLNLQLFPVEVATIVFENGEDKEKLQSFEFETVFVNKRGKITQSQQCQAYFYEEPLGEGIEPLKMIAIPEGEFLMGSPEDEKDRYGNESPQHQVKVSQFFMSQTPITQAQWRAIALLPRIQRKLNPNPSRFEENDNPVESVSWYDAIELCARLSRYTRRDYRLPSEAEWEYACRAMRSPLTPLQKGGTKGEGSEGQRERTYPFHFGETITSNLANYNGSVIYQEEPEGEYRRKTTPVRNFKPNAFGLYDMHGNVWEWCLDPWYKNYQGAPSDSRVWDERNKNNNHYQKILENLETFLKDERSKIIRGGAWHFNPRYCRSAYRNYGDPVNDFFNIGFRVVCGLPRTGNQ